MREWAADPGEGRNTTSSCGRIMNLGPGCNWAEALLWPWVPGRLPYGVPSLPLYWRPKAHESNTKGFSSGVRAPSSPSWFIVCPLEMAQGRKGYANECVWHTLCGPRGFAPFPAKA